MRRILPFLFLLHLVLVQPGFTQANEYVYVPESLQPWIEWVKQKNRDLTCPSMEKSRICVWPGKLSLSVDEDRAGFELTVKVERANSYVQLPGSQQVWPINVTSNGKDVTVLNRQGSPFALLGQGEHTLKGSFSWQKMPQAISVPPSVAVIELTVLGELVPLPRATRSGQLSLQEKREPQITEQDGLRIVVFRKLLDEAPFIVQTRINLTVTGSQRNLSLGRIIPVESTLIGVESGLSYELQEDYALVLHLESGRHSVELISAYDTPPETLQVSTGSSEEWPDQEVWVWQGNNQVRNVTLEGAPQIDPNRTELPVEWRSLPAYLMTPEETLQFRVAHRGQQSPPSNRIDLERKFWLDLNGDGYTIQDRFSGQMNQGWRINAGPDLAPGRIEVQNTAQVITTDPESGLSGIELREQSLQVSANSRLENRLNRIPAVGWDTDINKLSMDLALPPGWRLIGASGADKVSNSWIASWTLMHMFVILLIALATGKLLGIGWGVVALLGLSLAHGEIGAPAMLWIHLLAAASLKKVLPDETTGKQLATYYFYFVAFFLGVLLFFFGVSQLMYGLFPHLDRGSPTAIVAGVSHASVYHSARLDSSMSVIFSYLEGSFGALLMVTSFIAAVVCLFMRRWKLAGALLAIAILAFFLRSLTVAFFSTEDFSSPHVDRAAPYQQSFSGLRTEQYRENVTQKSFTRLQQDATVQTGPGLPAWSWRTWRLSWTGPVERNEEVMLYTTGPWTNLLLSLLRILLLIALFGAFMGKNFLRLSVGKSGTVAALLVMFSLMSFSSSAHAEGFPDQTLLTELEERLYGDMCKENCLTTETLHISLDSSQLRSLATVIAHGDSAWPVPGSASQVYPFEVKINGQLSDAIRRDGKGFLWVRIPDGKHSVEVLSRIPNQNVITLNFAQNPGNVTVEAPQWDISGLSETGHISGSLQLSRVSDRGALAETASEPENENKAIPEWFKVRRELTIGLPWTLTTSVTRMGSADRPTSTQVPLWAGEKISSGIITVENNRAVLNFVSNQKLRTWESTLEPNPELSLIAQSGLNQSEEWLVYCSPIFSCVTSGLNPAQFIVSGQHKYHWLPYPGEEVTLSITKPEPVPGESLTIQKAETEYRPGERILEATLTLEINATQSSNLELALPENSNLRSVIIDNQEVPLAFKEGKLALPISPKEQTVKVSWEQPDQRKTLFKAPRVMLDSQLVNVSVNVRMPQERWILFTSGPSWGPVVLFWGKLLIVLLLSLALSQFRDIPIKRHEWVLLGLGLTTLPPLLMTIPVLWFFLLKYRKESFSESSRFFNLSQVFIILFSLATAGIYYLIVQGGLILHPDMQIYGNNSTRTLLRWYSDMSQGEIPQPIIFSLPLWVWRCVAFAWSLWLAFMIIRWVRWGWGCFSVGGLWHKSTPETK